MNEQSTNIILVSIGNFQEYILINIRNLLQLNHTSIFVIINEKFKIHFDEFKDNKSVKLIKVEDLKEDFYYYQKTTLDKQFRNGFWAFTTLRLFYIYSLMKKLNLKNVIHLENDVIIYYNCDVLLKSIDKNKIYLPFDSYSRNIISIMYIPNCDIFQFLLQHYNMSLIDMSTFAELKTKFPNLIDNLPICVPLNSFNKEQLFVCNNFNLFNYIFDGIAMGQYVGGIDPRNTNNSSTIGFVNSSCVIKYNNYEIIWKTPENSTYKQPFLIIKEDDKNNEDKMEIPIFNLHIHSKKLLDFM
jgi:hypothetical protein